MHPKLTLPAVLAAAALIPLLAPTAASAAPVEPISIHDTAAARRSLARFVFGQPRVPRVQARLTTGVQTSRFRTVPNLRRVDRLTHKMPGGLTSTMYVLRPRRPNDRLLILHNGHGSTFSDPRATLPNVRWFLARGYTLIGIDMPLFGANDRPDLLPSIDPRLMHHALLEHPHPMRYFAEPIAAALNRVLVRQRFRSVSMTGISGGGWTTVLYAALDRRIQGSYPVAGSLPLPLRTRPEISDWEQHSPRLMAHANYSELYALGAVGRRQVQVFNVHDGCCFNGTRPRRYEPDVRRAVGRLGGGVFRVWLDWRNRGHSISPAAMRVIDRDIRRS